MQNNSSYVPQFQSESKCETILMKMTELHDNETACRTHFLKKGFAFRLVLKQRHKKTRKWPIKLNNLPDNLSTAFRMSLNIDPVTYK